MDSPAFPQLSIVAADGVMNAQSVPGMSLRDWFAGKALQGIMSDSGMRPCRDEEMVHLAKKLYQMADAMVAERSKAVAP